MCVTTISIAAISSARKDSVRSCVNGGLVPERPTMPDLATVYRFNDHAIAGVNWRPTRFVEAVPRSRVCSLCGVIPKRTVLLPCSHALCEPCYSANSYGYRGWCPLDQQRFEKAECCQSSFHQLNYKAYCWNEAHGCEFQGTVEEILRHYESNCKFHAVECLRCGEVIPHRELSRHYVSRCGARVSSARAADTSVEQKALTLQDVRPAFEELKALMRDANHEHLLLAIQSRINELTEEVRNHESRPPTITRGVAASANAEASQVAYSPTPSSVSQERAVRPNPTEEVGPSSSSSRQELFSMLSLAVLQQMRKTSTQDYPQHAIAHCGPNIACDLTLLRPLSTTRTWRELNGTVKYVLTLENLAKDMLLQERVMKIAEVTVLHTMDAYFVVEVSKDHRLLYVRVEFRGMPEGSLYFVPCLKLKARVLKEGHTASMHLWKGPMYCQLDSGSWVHFQRTYFIEVDFLKNFAYLRHRKMVLEIEVSRNQNTKQGT